MSRVPAASTAFATRDRDFILNVVARTPEADGYDDVVDWARTVTEKVGADGAMYVNFTGEAGADQVRASYPRETYDRLVAVKDRYDPANLFRLNQNIPPSAG
jgi:FAD/FMN-containing dehydrogenase